jgi:hypothetical protein
MTPRIAANATGIAGCAEPVNDASMIDGVKPQP